ncbi:oligosaccharide flippase family protein [Halomarina oriensis]|uniref:Oligosaccharide flippase family protein n=1 Tax=Halomarina oriensis TaxID=671145 RepID=A0A6B0GJR9_9EURY|nr:polysaccharide biosynthesis C-terminal domain-containing protein [Halomarina oriensis]MWG33053.1 oligosaccharide flippase family protein [Halomarina oriensis]
MSVSRSSLRLFAARVGTTALSFLALAYFARVLGSGQLGVFFLFQAALAMLVMLSDVGISTAIEKRMSAGGGPSVFWTGASVVGGVAGVLSAVVVGFRGVVSGYLGADLALLLALALLLTTAQLVLNAGLRGTLRTGETGDLMVLKLGLQWGLAAVLVWSGMDVFALVVGFLVGVTASNCWAAVKLRPSPATPTEADARSLLGYAKYNAIPSVGREVHSWMDVLVVGLLLTAADVAAYEIAWRVASVTTLLAGAIGVAIMPQTSAWDADGGSERIGRLVSAAFLPALVFVLPAVAGAVVVGEDLLRIAFGPEFTTASLVLVVLVAGKASEAIQLVVGRTLLGLDRPDLVARATALSLGLNLVLNVTLVLAFGLVGAAVATTLSFALGTALRMRYLGRFVPLSVPLADLAWCVGASLVMGGVLVALGRSVALDSAVALLGYLLSGALVYGVVLLVKPSLRETLVGYAETVLPETVFRA